MTDAEIIKAVRGGTHTLVPMPFGGYVPLFGALAFAARC